MENGKEKQETDITPKRTAKDTVFTSLFRDLEYVLQLYQALHPEDIKSKEGLHLQRQGA